MSRKKNIANYYQKQLEEKKKVEKQNRNRLLLILAAVAVVAIILAVTIPALIKDEPTEPVKITQKPIDPALLEDTIEVAFEIKDYGKITLELYPDVAPISVENFVNYVEDGFYDGLTFHRVIENFMIQGGDPKGTGQGDPTLKKIKGEFADNGVVNDLLFERGVIGMARSNDPNSASSQFFIMHKTTKSLDGYYAAFGKVIDGMDVVDAIATCEKTDTVDASGKKYVPAQTVIIEKAYIVE